MDALETRIRWELQRACNTDLPKKQRKLAMNRARYLIAQRSPETIKRMEEKAGLV